MSAKRPNILWVSYEDTYPYYGCYGDNVARTPTVDRLAAEGCRYTNGFSTSGVCAPARSAIITGMYPISIGTHHMRTTHTNRFTPEMPTPYSAVPPHYVKCFTEYLRAAGYYCTNNVKTDYQFDPPVTAWDELSTEAHWRNRPDPDQPFFAVFNPTESHESGAWEENEVEVAFNPDDVTVPPYLPDTPRTRLALAKLYSHLENVDKEFGKLLDQLEEDGLADNTIVMHWSDHGPLPRGKRWPYDAGIHVPLIVRWPGGIAPGSVCEDMVSTVDLGPTVLSLCGLDVPAYMQGQVFLGDHSDPPREYIYASRDRFDESYDMVRAVRSSRFKYLRNYKTDVPYTPWIPYLNRHPIMQEMWRLHMEDKLEGPTNLMFQYPRPAEELYDIEADPHELHNLARDPEAAEELTIMRAALDDWLDDVGDMGRMNEADMVRAWYPNGERPTTAPVLMVPICEESPGRNGAPEGGSFAGPALLQLHCPTQGASIAYALGDGEPVRWQLYHRPLKLSQGTTTVRAKAIRIGYHEGEERVATFEIK